jgi:Icc-related predicted phosphoesterase
MKFLCVSERIDSYVYSRLITERFNVDAVLCAGDIPLDYIDFLSAALKKPVFFVSGNHHFYTESMELPHAQSADFKCLKSDICGKTVLIAGAPGSIRCNGNPSQYTDAQMLFHLLAMYPALIANKIRYGRCLDIFLTHAPPQGINDFDDPCHRGFACYRQFIERFLPRFHVHGHIHLYDPKSPRTSRHKNTDVVNACGHCVIEL